MLTVTEESATEFLTSEKKSTSYGQDIHQEFVNNNLRKVPA